jgi:hypothetical protein
VNAFLAVGISADFTNQHEGDKGGEMKRRIWLLVVLLALLVGSSTGAGVAQEQDITGTALDKPLPENFQTLDAYSEALVNWAVHEHPIGRYQIVMSTVVARDTFLLDTMSGATWISCDVGDGGATKWCLAPRTTSTSTAGK